MNERGDVAFNVNYGYAGPRIVYANGTMQDFPVAGASRGEGTQITNDGALLGRYLFLVRDPVSKKSVHMSKSVLFEASGSEIEYSGSFAYGHFWGATPDGVFLGAGSEKEFERFSDFPEHPIAWSPSTGETILELPQGAPGGQALLSNPAGGYVGIVSNEVGTYNYVWWDEAGRVTGLCDFYMVPAGGWAELSIFAAVRADGVLIGCHRNRLMEFRPDGTRTPYGPAFDGYVNLVDSNSAGFALGVLRDPYTIDYKTTNTLWMPDGRAVDLDALFPADSPWAIADVHDLTESGDILVRAQLRADSSVFQAFIIRGIPSPGGVVMAACAGLMVLAYRRR